MGEGINSDACLVIKQSSKRRPKEDPGHLCAASQGCRCHEKDGENGKEDGKGFGIESAVLAFRHTAGNRNIRKLVEFR